MKLFRRRNDLDLVPYERIEQDVFEQSHSVPTWAVSYADLLMVLMSFFVIFYETKMDTKESTGLYKLAVSLGLSSAAPLNNSVSGSGSQPNSAAEPAPNAKSESPAGLEATLPKSVETLKELFKNRSESKADEITIFFQDNLFESGQFDLSTLAANDLKVLSETLSPEIDKLQLTVIGHADSTLVKYRNEFLKDNFDLSVQRAISVLKKLMAHGLPAKSLSAQGSADNSIAKRTITIRIQLKEKSQ